MSKVYFISGLGADWRMFQFLKLPQHLPQQHVNWIPPLHQDEPLQAYVQRLKEQISDPDPILVGLSFGGVVAIELSKILKPRKTIIISSLANKNALPWYYRSLGKTNVHKWLPFRLMQSTWPLAPWFFGAHSKAERKLLKRVILEIDEKFLRWSLARLLDWQQEEVPADLVQVHGTSDHVLPLVKRQNIIKVQGGEHLMVMHLADEVSKILSRILLDCSMTNKNKFIVTTTNGQTADLTNATTLKSNNLYPFGRHNYAVYETPEGVFVRGLNSGERETMFTHFEMLDEETARNYKHDYYREDN